MKYLKQYENYSLKPQSGNYIQLNLPIVNNSGNLAQFRNFINANIGVLKYLKGYNIVVEYTNVPDNLITYFHQDETKTKNYVIVNMKYLSDFSPRKEELIAKKYNI